MNRKQLFEQNDNKILFEQLNDLHSTFSDAFRTQFDRSLPFADELFDRWERAKQLNCGERSSVYDSSYVFGSPIIGEDVWIGPFTIIDGSGGLSIGKNVTIAVGVHIYTHDNIKQTLIGKHIPLDKGVVYIGDYSYIGPNAIITKNVTIGKHSIVAANSLVNKSFDDYSIIAGTPAKKIGYVKIEGDNLELIFNKV